MCYISGSALRKQRIYAGLSQRNLSDLIKAATGIEITQKQISRMENSFETCIDPALALTLKKILS